MITFKYNIILGLMFWIFEPKFTYKNNNKVLPRKQRIKSAGRTKIYS
jgi:hypothetical protein